MSAPAATDVLRFEVEDGLATLTLNRPDAMNALNMDLKVALAEALREIPNRPEIRAVLLTGEGRAFSAGGDIQQMDPDRGAETTRRRMTRLTREVVMPLARLEIPTVAAVNGHCHGLGLGLAMACDVTIAGEGSTLSAAFCAVGLGPDGATSYFLPRLVGLARAKDLMFTSRRIKGVEAAEIGLVSRVVPDDRVVDEARELARKLASGPTVALGTAKRLLNQSNELTIEDATQLESYGQAITMTSEDHREGIQSFREKRPPSFTGS
jgi:2-(1,2-epoxy-1,2-dihydrophenyl)acetyl-CoA isomerase